MDENTLNMMTELRDHYAQLQTALDTIMGTKTDEVDVAVTSLILCAPDDALAKFTTWCMRETLSLIHNPSPHLVQAVEVAQYEYGRTRLWAKDVPEDYIQKFEEITADRLAHFWERARRSHSGQVNDHDFIAYRLAEWGDAVTKSSDYKAAAITAGLEYAASVAWLAVDDYKAPMVERRHVRNKQASELGRLLPS